MDTAWTVFALDSETGAFAGVGIYSEPSPTVAGHRVLFESSHLPPVKAASYGEARTVAIRNAQNMADRFGRPGTPIRDAIFVMVEMDR